VLSLPKENLLPTRQTQPQSNHLQEVGPCASFAESARSARKAPAARACELSHVSAPESGAFREGRLPNEGLD
jgi:hypothetical protein